MVPLLLSCLGGSGEPVDEPAARPPVVVDASAVDEPDRPPECRQEHFPTEGDSFTVYAVTEAQVRLYLSGDEGGCPLTGDCLGSAYLLPGDRVLVNHTLGDFQCAWYANDRGQVTVGWLPSAGLSPEEATGRGWTGAWRYGDSTITIARQADGALLATGEVLSEDSVPAAALSQTALEPVGRAYAARPTEGCTISLTRVGDWLTVDDGSGCDTTFRGVYRR